MAKTEHDPIAEAKAELAQLTADRAAWQSERDTATADLEKLATDRGRQLVDGDTTADALADQEARLRSRIASAEAATNELDRRAAEARGRVLTAYVATLEEQLRPHQQAFDDHRADVDALLAQLEDLDGVAYRPMDVRERARQVHGEDVVDLATVKVPASRTDLLRMPVTDLRGRIDMLAPYAGRPLDDDEYTEALTKADRAIVDEPRTATMSSDEAA